MQRLSENLSRIWRGDGWGGRAIIAFRIHAGGSVVHGGVELKPNDMVRFSPGQSYYQHSSGPAGFGAMSLPVAEMVSVGAAMAGCDLAPPRDTLIVTPLPHAVAKLQRLHAAAGHLAETVPEIIANPNAAYGLEQAFIEAMVGCLRSSEAREDSASANRPPLRFIDQPNSARHLSAEIG